MTEKPKTTLNSPVPAKESIQTTTTPTNMNGITTHSPFVQIYSDITPTKPPELRFGEINGVGSVLQKLTIFEKIKLLNADSQDETREQTQIEPQFKRDKDHSVPFMQIKPVTEGILL